MSSHVLRPNELLATIAHRRVVKFTAFKHKEPPLTSVLLIWAALQELGLTIRSDVPTQAKEFAMTTNHAEVWNTRISRLIWCFLSAVCDRFRKQRSVSPKVRLPGQVSEALHLHGLSSASNGSRHSSYYLRKCHAQTLIASMEAKS